MMHFLKQTQLEALTSEWERKLTLDCERTFDLANCALIVCDMQNDFLNPDGSLPVWGGPATIENINRLVDAFSATGKAVVFTEHHCLEPNRHVGHLGIMNNVKQPTGLLQPGSFGAAIHAEIQIPKNAIRIVKYRYSAFFDTPLRTILKINGITQVLIAGVATNICCETTAHEAFFNGLDVLFALDATGGTSEDAHIASIRNIQMSYGSIVSTHQVASSIRDSQLRNKHEQTN